MCSQAGPCRNILCAPRAVPHIARRSPVCGPLVAMPRAPPTLCSACFKFAPRLYLNSDAGSNLWINDDLVVENEFKHRERELFVSIFLSKGLHKSELSCGGR